MVQKCIVRDCESTWYPGGFIKYHPFPKDIDRRNQWLSVIPLKKKFYECARICSLHFRKTDYDYCTQRLNDTAVPFYGDDDTSLADLDMDPPDEIPVFVDMDRGPEYTELDKQNMLATILTEPIENNMEIGSVSEQSVQIDEQTQPSPSFVEHSDAQVEKTEEPKPRIRCPECHRYTTDNEERMVRHIRKNHKGQNPFQCTMCDYSTYNKSVFEEHVRIHKGIKPFKCAHCPYRSASKKNKNKHELIHRKNNPLKCELCPFIAHHYRSLLCHKLKHEKGELGGNNEEIENAELKCDVCSFNFPTEAALSRHRTNNKNRVCDVCSARFCSTYYLKKHRSICHDAKKELFECAVCGWTGSIRVKVLLHLIHHPQQTVDESLFDLSVLRKHGIMN